MSASPDADEVLHADVVVVGAGSTGAVLAARLSEDPAREVVLLEAGPDYPDFEALPDELKLGRANAVLNVISDDHNWCFRGRATNERPDMPVARGRVTGGSSAVNGQVFLKGLAEDFAGWARAGGPGWDAESMAEAYRRLETDRDFQDAGHGTDGPVPIRRFARREWHPAQAAFHDAALDAGHPEAPDQNAPGASGVGPVPLNNVDGIRMSTALTYLAPARGRRNLRIIAGTTAERVLWDGHRAVGIRATSASGGVRVLADEVVLSAGSIGSAHLLMLSGVGPAAQLTAVRIPVVHDAPGVGAGFQDHPMVGVGWLLRAEHHHHPDAPRCQVTLRFTAPGSDRRDDVWAMPILWKDTVTMWCGVHGPSGRGLLRLVSSDPRQQPALDYQYLEDESDRRRLRDTVREAVRVGEQARFRGVVERRESPSDQDFAADDALDAWLLRSVVTSNHIVGTCPMGAATDPAAVVDGRGLVHGVENLRVADASIMPFIPRAAPNATAMALGERFAAILGGTPPIAPTDVAAPAT